MAQYDESEYFTDLQEEVAEREAQEALRRMVRTEIRRVHTGAAAEDIADDIAREERERAMESCKRNKPRWMVWITSAVTGDILLAEEVKRAYNLFTLVGVTFFVSMAVIFAALQRDMQCTRLKKEVERLRERSIRISEECHQQTSHSEIVRKLKSRGIALEDPAVQPKRLK